LYRARRYDEAIVQLTRAIDLDPNHPMPYLPLGLSYSMTHRHDEAVRTLDQGLALAPESTELVAQLAHAHDRAGNRQHSQAALETLRGRTLAQHVSPFSMALVHMALGDAATSLDWLERAYVEREWLLCVLKTEPILDPLRQEPRFQNLLKRMRFPG
jgi:tetratricopeptide (TPR) repeat protein